VFPEGMVFANLKKGEGSDVVLLGQADPGPIDLDAIAARLRLPEFKPVRDSLSEIGFGSLADLLGTFAVRKPELDPWLTDAQINRDRNLRLQYLAGISFNVTEAEAIYRDMARYRTFPEGLFIGSLQQMVQLRMAFEREGGSSPIEDFDKAIEAEANGEFEIAIDYYTKIINSGEVGVENLAVIYSNRASLYAGLGESNNALEDFSESLQLNPNAAVTYANRGAHYEQLKQYDRAIQDYDEAIRLEPKNPLAYNNRCYVLLTLDRAQEALLDCNAALVLDPENPIIIYTLGNAYEALGEEQRAAQEYERALEIAPDFEPARESLEKL